MPNKATVAYESNVCVESTVAFESNVRVRYVPDMYPLLSKATDEFSQPLLLKAA